MAKATYHGEPFPEIVHAMMEFDSEKAYPSYDDGPITEVAQPHPMWIAKYRLVSVRRLRRKVTVTAQEVRR